MSRPMRDKASRSPVRVGLTPTLRTTIELPGVIAAAMMKNAAAEKSPATSTFPPCSGAGPSRMEFGVPLDLRAEMAQEAFGMVA